MKSKKQSGKPEIADSAPDTGLSQAADEVRGLCAVITKMARTDLQDRLDTRGAGISALEHGVMRRMAQGVHTMAEISRLMAVIPSTLVYVIDSLVEKGLIRREKDPNDRRREPIVFEDKGRRLLAGIPNMDDSSVLVQSLAKMSERQRKQLLSLLRTFVAGLPNSTQKGTD